MLVVVLHYNGYDDTISCLDTITNQQSDRVRILVVDNGSTDNIQDVIKSTFPTIQLLRLSSNQGWAGGNNAAIKWGKEFDAKCFMFVNNDTLFPPQSIATLAALSRELPFCLLHPAIDFADPTEGAQLDPLLTKDSASLDGYNDLFEIDYAYGACLVVPAEIFRRVGLFDERFFLQLEETDFFIRARAIGVRSVCTRAVRIIHAESRSFGGRMTPTKVYYIVRNNLLLTEKHEFSMYGYLRTVRRIYWSIINIREEKRTAGKRNYSILFWLLSADPFASATRHGVRDYLIRRFGKMPTPAESR